MPKRSLSISPPPKTKEIPKDPLKGASSLANPIRPLCSPDKMVEFVFSCILMRRIDQGYRLVEADLANSLKVSRGTVRQALKSWPPKVLC